MSDLERGDSPLGFWRLLFSQKENDKDMLDFAITFGTKIDSSCHGQSLFLLKIHCNIIFLISYGCSVK